MVLELIRLKNIEESRLTAKQKRIFTAIIIVLVFLFTCALAVIIGKPMVDLVKDHARFRDFVEKNGILSDIVFILMVIFQIIIAIVPGEPFELAAGYAFGNIRGTIDCMLAFLIGGIAVFLFVRKFGVKVVEIFFPIEKIRELEFLNDPKRLNVMTFIVFLIPGTPKDLLSYFVGLTDMKLSVWIIITTVARFPSLITSVVIGNAINAQDYVFAVSVTVITAVLSGLGLLIYNKIKAKNNN